MTLDEDWVISGVTAQTQKEIVYCHYSIVTKAKAPYGRLGFRNDTVVTCRRRESVLRYDY